MSATEFERWLRNAGARKDANWGYLGPRDREYTLREEAIREFGFAILTAEAAQRLATHGPILEVGAGAGYWAYELQKLGCDVIATDPAPLSCCPMVTPERIWTPAEPLTALQALEKYGVEDRTLMMVWPSWQGEWTGEALRQYLEMGGQKLIYCGEPRGGCTGNAELHDLMRDMVVVEQIIIPRWFGIRDNLVVLEVAS